MGAYTHANHTKTLLVKRSIDMNREQNYYVMFLLSRNTKYIAKFDRVMNQIA
jgi:hypothetical protein